MKKRVGFISKRYLFLACIGAIALLAVFGDKGLVDVVRLKKDRNGILGYNNAIEAANRALEKEIKPLRNDKRYIEYVAKKELGMIGKDEIVYRFEDTE